MKAEAEGAKPRRSAFAAAVAVLAMREHSRVELRQKLEQRDYSAEDIGAALHALEETGLVSDECATRARVASGLRRGHGPTRIRQALNQAGLPTDAAMTDDDGERVDWVAQASALVERKFGEGTPTDYKEWARRARFLHARGYDTETIQQALPAIGR